MTIKEIIKNKKELIKLKKATIKEGDIISFAAINPIDLKSELIKEDNDNELFRTIVGNTYGFMDSHDDVHIKGIFTKSINENGSNVLHLHDHVHQLTAKVGTPLKVYEQEVKWEDVGLKKAGSTTALLMDTRIEKARNSNIFTDYKSNQINQHSVGMQYVKLELAVNDPEEKEEFATWERYKNQVANIDKAEEQGYFWAVTEAKLIEISAVIKGSNELTPTLAPNTKGVESLKGLVSEEIYIALQSALETKEAVSLTLHNKVEPQKHKSIFEIMAKKA